ncbi:MAG TPA: CoA transferase [Candidatus Acidoferrales bacterium]|nr:CoA transferase [Candidatus Acidoferrales bacterium]
MQSSGPLSGIRVIDFGRFIAGPYCAMLLADMGADVIRIDRRQGSEDRYLTPVAATGEGTSFLSLNRNKRSLTLDLAKPQASEIVHQLVRTADVVVANLPIEVLKKAGLDYDALKAIKSDIIFARISTFGPDGPYSKKVGFDAVAQSMTGAMHLTGFPDAPVRSVVPFEDYGTALHTAFGVVVALYHRSQSGEGQIVDTSLLSTGITFMQTILAERQVLGIERRQTGNTSFYAAPADCYRACDGWIMVSIVGHEMFARWARLVGHQEFISDPRFTHDQQRADNHPVINEAMNIWLSSRTTAQAIAELEAARIPAGPVLDPGQVLADPQVKARRLLQEVEFPGAPAPIPLASPAVSLSATPPKIRHRAPMLGEHTGQILEELGYSKAEIANLRKAEAV